jgi:hypothetical protein
VTPFAQLNKAVKAGAAACCWFLSLPDVGDTSRQAACAVSALAASIFQPVVQRFKITEGWSDLQLAHLDVLLSLTFLPSGSHSCRTPAQEMSGSSLLETRIYIALLALGRHDRQPSSTVIDASAGCHQTHTESMLCVRQHLDVSATK